MKYDIPYTKRFYSTSSTSIILLIFARNALADSISDNISISIVPQSLFSAEAAATNFCMGMRRRFIDSITLDKTVSEFIVCTFKVISCMISPVYDNHRYEP